mgnify:CR=1 FL=1
MGARQTALYAPGGGLHWKQGYAGTTDFWKIAAGSYLHTETDNYVPKLIAAAIIGGTLAIVAIYLAANAAYLYVSPLDIVATSPLIAAETMQVVFGRFGASFVSVVVTISTFGALIATNGGQVVITGLTSYAHSVDADLQLRAEGSGSLLSLPNLTTLAGRRVPR